MYVEMIVLNYNDAKLTTEYIEKVQKFKSIDHITIVDNCSTDNSYEILMRLKNNKVSVFKTSSNNGYACGNNQGVKNIPVTTDNDTIIIISNPDIIVDESSVKQILDSFIEFPDQFAATGEVYNLNGNRIGLFTWKVPSFAMLFLESSVLIRKIGYLFHFGRRYFGKQLSHDHKYYYGEALPGCFFAARLDKFKELGLFDEDTFLYFEEDILFSKAKKNGFLTRVVKDAKIIHAEGVSTKKSIKSFKQRELIMEQSCRVYMEKCLKCSNALILIYSIWNRIWMPERFLMNKIKNNR